MNHILIFKENDSKNNNVVRYLGDGVVVIYGDADLSYPNTSWQNSNDIPS